jgi:hypothetical protein
MTVALNFERTAAELTYDKSAVQGKTINVRAEGEDGDISTRDELANDGRFVWTVPTGFTGKTMFTVAGVDGGSDDGEIDWSAFPSGGE